MAKVRKLKVGQILFSQGTYQVEIKEPGRESVWPFLQLDERGEVLDCFCTCKRAEREKGCSHLKVAKEAIFRGKGEPLHVRFRSSLWNQLCLMAGARSDFDAKALIEKKEGALSLASDT